MLDTNADLRDRMLGTLRATLGADAVTIVTGGGRGERLRAVAPADLSPSPDDPLLPWLGAHTARSVIPDLARAASAPASAWLTAQRARSLLVMPVALDDGLTATLAAVSHEPDRFAACETGASALLVAAVRAALESSWRADAADMVRAVAKSGTAPGRSNIGAVVRAACQHVAQLCDGDRASLFLFDHRGYRALVGSMTMAGESEPERFDRFRARWQTGRRPEPSPAMAWILEKRTALVIDDYRESPMGDPSIADAFGTRSAVVVPLLHDDRVVGVLAVDRTEVRPFGPTDVRLATAAAECLAPVVERVRLLDETETQLRQAEAQLEIARSLAATIELRPLLRLIGSHTARACGMDRCSVFLSRGERMVPVMSQFADGRMNHDLSDMVKALESGGVDRIRFVEEAVETREPVVVDDAQTDPRVPAALREFKGKRLLALPLIRPDKILGVLVLDYVDRDRAIHPAQISVGMTIGSQIALAMENAALYEDAQTHARELEILGELRRRLASTLDLDAVLSAVAESAERLTGADRSVVFEADTARGMLSARATRGIAPDTLGPVDFGHDPARVVASCREAMLRCAGPTRAPGPAQRAVLAVPIVPQRTAAYAIAVYWESGQRRTPSASRLLTALAQQATVAIDNAALYREAQQALVALQTKNAELDSFVSTVSHDLKAPLVTIDGLSGILVNEYGDALTPDVRRYIDRICASVTQMERLIQDLLALSRIGREARPVEPVALDEIVDDALAVLSDRIDARGVAISRAPLGTVCGIRTQLQQVWTNLLSNAVKYLGDTPAPRVEIRAEERDEWLECTVTDNGIGIDPAYHERIFAMFQRLKDVEAEGTGIGLPIVKKIVEAAGGRVWVESAKGQGATFRFTWPLPADLAR